MTSDAPNPVHAGRELFARYWNGAVEMLGEDGSGYDSIARQRDAFDKKHADRSNASYQARVRRAKCMVGIDMLKSIAQQVGMGVPIGESLELRPANWDYASVGKAEDIESGVILKNLGEPYYDSILEHTQEIECVGVLNEAWTWGEAVDIYRDKVQAAKEDEVTMERAAASATYRSRVLERVLDEFDRTGQVAPVHVADELSDEEVQFVEAAVEAFDSTPRPTSRSAVLKYINKECGWKEGHAKRIAERLGAYRTKSRGRAGAEGQKSRGGRLSAGIQQEELQHFEDIVRDLNAVQSV